LSKKDVWEEIVPPERREELKAKYEELNARIAEKEQELKELREKRTKLERILVALGLIEKAGVAPARIRGEAKTSVRKYIMDLGEGKEFKFTDVVKATGQTRGTVWAVLRAMEANGEIQKIGRGLYRVVGGSKGKEGGGDSLPS